MRINVYHVGRTGKETSVTFDTETKQYCTKDSAADLRIYVEQTRDVKNLYLKLKYLGFIEVLDI
jgi:hypothetical protein